jgi:hypothetical protein
LPFCCQGRPRQDPDGSQEMKKPKTVSVLFEGAPLVKGGGVLRWRGFVGWSVGASVVVG